MLDAPHGWVWLDDDGWEHNPSEQHPHERGEAEYGEQFRPATAKEAVSPEFFRCPEVHSKPPGFDKAYEAALEDARQLNAGFFMIAPSGCRHVPAEAVSIDAAKYLEMTRDAES